MFDFHVPSLCSTLLCKVSKALTSEQKRKLREKLVFYKDKEGRLRRFDTDSSANKKYS